jgi:carboxypeptidase C (cathepsin A)
MNAALARALHKNGSFRVCMVSGYYDLATPYFITENAISHMGLGSELRERVVNKVYPGEHAIYLDNDIRLRLTTDAASFYKNAFAAEKKVQSVKGDLNR